MIPQTEPKAFFTPVGFNNLCFVLSIVTLIIGFTLFNSFDLIDLSTMLFAVVFIILRVKAFRYDRHCFQLTDSLDPHFQTVLFLSIITWLVWILSGYFIFDNAKRTSFILTAVAMVLQVLKMVLAPLSKQAQGLQKYRVTINIIFVILLVCLRAFKGFWPIFIEWVVILLLFVILAIDYFKSKKFISV